MTDATTETLLMRLADSVAGYREEDAFAAQRAGSPAEREAIDATLDALVERGCLRRESARHYLPAEAA